MSEKQDVLIITQFYPPESMGGAHRWEQIASNLDDAIEPHILTTYPTFPFGQFERVWRPISHEKNNGIPVTRLFTYQPSSGGPIGRILNYGLFSILSTIYILLTFWRYDTVVTMSAPHTTFFPGLVGKLLGRNWFIDIFDLWIDNAADLGYIERNSLPYRTMAYLEQVSFRISDGVFVITETLEEYYRSKYTGLDFDSYIVPFGIDTKSFSPDVSPTTSTDIIYTGNVGSGQAFVPFFEGLANLDRDIELTIIGDGERRQELEDLAEELNIEGQVIFEGYIPRDQIPGRIAGASLSIVPLKTEHQLDYARPTKLLETMAVGTPYLASNITEIDNLSQQYETGITVDNNPNEVSEAIKQLLQDSSKRAHFKENSVTFIQKEHCWEEVGMSVSSTLGDEKQ